MKTNIGMKRVGRAGCHGKQAVAECPELYFLRLESYSATVPTPLAGTQANQALALHLKERR